MVAGIGEDTAAVDQNLEFSVSMAHLRTDAIFRFEFALQAPGQASLVGSNKAAENLDFDLSVHRGLFLLANIHGSSRIRPIQFQSGGIRT